MKRILILISMVLMMQNLFAQGSSKFDKIIKKDYDVIEANITKISDKEIEFTFPGETLTNVLNSDKVAKIIFKNGRVQEFKTEAKKESAPQYPKEAPKEEPKIEVEKIHASIQKIPIKQNTIAVLPIPFVNTETLASSVEMSKFAQNDVYSKLIDNSANIFPLTVQDLRETNALLKKAGIDYSNIDEIPVKDLQNALGVDHIIASKVSYLLKTNQINTTQNTTTLKKNDNTKIKVDDFSSTIASENKLFQYTVYFDIYKNGTKIFTERRNPFFNSKDSWMSAMQYLLKRCPIYVR